MRAACLVPADSASEDVERFLSESCIEDGPHQVRVRRHGWPWQAVSARAALPIALLVAAALCLGGRWTSRTSPAAPEDREEGTALTSLASAQAPTWSCHHWSALETKMLEEGSEGKDVLEERQKEVCLRSRGKHLDYVWTGGDKTKAPGCGDCRCCWRVKPWELHQTLSGPMAARLHAPRVAEEDGQCSFAEEGYDYPGGDIKRVDGVEGGKACCGLCRAEPTCTSWTWQKPGKNRSGSGSGSCSLKSQGEFQREPKSGFVSGIPRARDLPSFQVRASHGLCLDAGGELLHMGHCSPRNPHQQWTYDPSSGHLRALSSSGPCLHAPAAAESSDAVGKSSCGVGAKGSQQWDFTSGHGVIQHLKSGLCLAPKSGGSEGSPLELQPCADKTSGWALRRTWVPPDPAVKTFYIYRAQSDADYPAESINAADIRGVMWYLHNEVVRMCPRKYGITRILRLKMSMREDQMGPFAAFDSGLCTVPNCEKLWKEGFRIGCQERYYGDLLGHWYSLPGACPSRKAKDKTMKCMLEEPGGACDWVTGQRNCTYHVEHAGEIRIDELTGIRNYTAFCAKKNAEYSKELDKGIGLTFWDGFHDPDRNSWRAEQLGEAFAMKYPHMPMVLDPPLCVRR